MGEFWSIWNGIVRMVCLLSCKKVYTVNIRENNTEPVVNNSINELGFSCIIDTQETFRCVDTRFGVGSFNFVHVAYHNS